jgi:hypothetical protein
VQVAPLQLLDTGQARMGADWELHFKVENFGNGSENVWDRGLESCVVRVPLSLFCWSAVLCKRYVVVSHSHANNWLRIHMQSP